MENQPKMFDKKSLYILLNAMLFVSGFSIVFVVLGASVTWLGSLALTNLGVLTKLSGVIIIFFGLVKTGVFKINLFNSTQVQLGYSLEQAGAVPLHVSPA